MFACVYIKHLLHSMYERASAAHEMTVSQMKEIAEIFSYDINKIRSKTETYRIILIVS